MKLKPLSSFRRTPRGALVSAALCALIGCAALGVTLTSRAQQSGGPKALVRRGLTLNGRIEGSVQQLTGENTTLNGNAAITGDLLAPGTPSVRQNGHPTFGGTAQGSGGAQPSNYQITLNGNAQLGRAVTRTDPVAMPAVAAPPASTGTRDVTLNNSGQSAGNFSTVRDLTLNGNVGVLAVPPGTYRNFTVNGNGAIALGVAGASQPAVYNLNSLTLNGGSRLDVVGPVVLTTASAVTLNAAMGSNAQPLWLSLKVASGGVTLNGGASLYGSVTAPSGTVTINGNASLTGGLACDRLTMSGNALLRLLQSDTTPPALNVAGPLDNGVTNELEVSVKGTVSDATPTTVTVNGVTASIEGDSFSATVPLASEGLNVLTVSAVDAAGNRTSVERRVTRDTIAPTLTLTSPADGQFVRALELSGSATDALPVEVTFGGEPLALAAGGAFSRQYEFREGPLQVRVTATDAAGNVSEVIRSVTVDLTPPDIRNLTPDEGSVVDSPTTVRGSADDASPVTVRVNNSPASVAAGNSFTAENVAVAEGENRLQVTAVDAVGNETIETLVLVGRDRTAPSAPVLFPATSPTRLLFQTVSGRAESGSVVTIEGGAEPATVNAASGNGIFAANVMLAAGENNLTVTARDAQGNTSAPARVSITSDPNLALPPEGQPAQINISIGNAQKGLVKTELPRPLVAIVTDRGGSPAEGVVVKFKVQEGGGQFVGGADFIDVTTDEHGHARARYVLGEKRGLNHIRADFNGNTMTPSVFLAEALEPDPGGETMVAGSVLDQNLRALPNVLVRLAGQQTRTAANGSFLLRNVPSGAHQLLELIGRDQVALPGRWPNISYDLDLLPGVLNETGRPFFLPKVSDGVPMPLDAQGVVTEDTSVEVVAVGGEPPIRVTAKAGTRVVFPPDATDKRLSVTRIPTNRVPMTLEDGRATGLYISVQPSGAIFDPPLEVSFPNLDRLPAGAEALLMSFDHDAGRYVRVGTGHVSADARTVRSDPNNGIRVGAWHAAPPPPPKPEVTVQGHVQIKDNPVFLDKIITTLEAWVEGVRAVLNPSVDAIEGAPRVEAMATLAVAETDIRSAVMEAKAEASRIKVDPKEVFVAVDEEKEVTATLDPPPDGEGAFKWEIDDEDAATVMPKSDTNYPSKVKIKGLKAGTTKLKVEYVDKTNPKNKFKTEVKLTVGSVKYTTQQQCMGFDDTQRLVGSNKAIYWLVVHENQPNAITEAHIKPEAAAPKVTFSSTNPAAATVAPATANTDKQPLIVIGGARGTTDIKSAVDNTPAETLHVSVKMRRVIKVTFNYVSDSTRDGGTKRNVAEAESIIFRLNQIYGPQTNVEFVLQQARTITVPINFDGVVDRVPCASGQTAGCGFNSPEVDAILQRGDPSADRNVFFVKKLENSPEQDGTDLNGIGENPGNNVVIEDGLNGDLAQVVGHELGHNFGLGHHVGLANMFYLMYDNTPGGCFITKDEADTVNP